MIGDFQFAVLLDANPAEALGAQLLAHELLEAIDLAARELLRVRDRQRFHDATVLGDASKGLELARHEHVGQVDAARAEFAYRGDRCRIAPSHRRR